MPNERILSQDFDIVFAHIAKLFVALIAKLSRSLPTIRIPSSRPFDDENSIMTGRQDVSPVASVKAENIQKDLQNQQGRDEMLRRQEIVKQSKRPNLNQKQPRPPMEIYRPPS